MDGQTRLVSTRALVRVMATSLSCVAAGGVVGVFASLYHSAWFPWGLIVIMVALAGGLAGLRCSFRSRFPALVAGLSLLGAIAALAGLDGQGSVIISGNLPGFALLIGAGMLVATVTAFPSPREVRRKPNAPQLLR